jgi:hypothetical protein
MKTSRPAARMARRRFLHETAATAGLIGLGGLSRASEAAAGPRQPFDYDLERFRNVDPALIGYQRVARIRITQPEPRRIALGIDGRLRLAAGNAVLRLDEFGAVLDRVVFPAGVRSLAVASDGILYAGVKDHVEVLDPRGRKLAAWDAPRGRPLLTGLAAGATDLFVADAGNRVVWRYDRDGKLLRRIGEKNPDRNIPGFVVPSPFFDVALGRDGLLRAANPGRHRIETYTLEGDLEFAWGRAGAGIEAFCGCCNPVNLELMPDGRVVTLEKGLPRVKVYSARGELESVVAPPSAFADPAKRACEWIDCSYGGLDGAVDSQGRIYVLDLIAGDIQVMAERRPPRAGEEHGQRKNPKAG